MINKDIDYILLMVSVTFVFTALIMPFMAKIANYIGAMDIPRTRHIHTKPMPKLGGLGIFLGFLFGYMLFGINSIQMNSVLIGSFIIVMTGIIDDIRPIKFYHKLIGQIAAAAVIVFYGQILDLWKDKQLSARADACLTAWLKEADKAPVRKKVAEIGLKVATHLEDKRALVRYAEAQEEH
jgi:UDP-N-acetylmuramyl pentapeptide phosphotransferase/UDP-N-acetylglucosamine-1-phosphate transferase